MTDIKVCLSAPQNKFAYSFYASRIKSLQKCHPCWGCLNLAKQCWMTCAPLPAKWQYRVFAAHRSPGSLVWQGIGQQRVDSVSPVLTLADRIPWSTQKERLEKGICEQWGWRGGGMGKAETGVQNKDGWKQCDPQGEESRSQARRQELRLCKKNVHGRQGAQQDLKRPSQRQLATWLA